MTSTCNFNSTRRYSMMWGFLSLALTLALAATRPITNTISIVTTHHAVWKQNHVCVRSYTLRKESFRIKILVSQCCYTIEQIEPPYWSNVFSRLPRPGGEPWISWVLFISFPYRKQLLRPLSNCGAQLLSGLMWWAKSVPSESSTLMTFCSCGLPLARSRWFRSTLSSHCSLSSNQCHWTTSGTLIIFLPKKILDCWETNRGVAEWEARTLPLCYAAPSHPPPPPQHWGL